MRKEELIDTLRVFMEQQIFGTGMIPNKSSMISDGNSKWEDFKIQFDKDSFSIIKEKVVNIRYEDVLGITYESHDDTAKINMYMSNRIPLTIKMNVKTKWCHFTSTSSVMKYRWGDYETGKYMYGYGEVSRNGSPYLTFTRKPFDFNLSGDLVVLEDDEPWLGFLIRDENEKVCYHEIGTPKIVRTLKIVDVKQYETVVEEIIQYDFEKSSYRSVSYYNIRKSEYMQGRK